MSMPAIIAMRRKKLLSIFEKLEATNVEKAITLQEINKNFGKIGIEPLRSHSILKGVELLLQRGNIQKTEDDKYYLTIQK